MTVADERLKVRMGIAHVRFVEDVTLALKEAEPSQADLEEALLDQIGHGRRLLEMADAACYLASVTRLQPTTRSHMELALTVAVQAFRDLQEMVLDWTRRHGALLTGPSDLALLLDEMNRYRGELAAGLPDQMRHTGPNHAAFPKVGTADWGQMNKRRAELIRKNLRGELSEAERSEYEALQRASLAAVDAALPRQGNAPPANDHAEACGE